MLNSAERHVVQHSVPSWQELHGSSQFSKLYPPSGGILAYLFIAYANIVVWFETVRSFRVRKRKSEARLRWRALAAKL